MTTQKKLGIWMDHANAHLIEFSTDPATLDNVELQYSHEEKEETVMSKGEHVMHNKEQQQQGEFYKSIAEIIKNYQEVILFGPTDAKVELSNILKEDHHFDKIKVSVETTQKMSENQMKAFVKDFFSKN